MNDDETMKILWWVTILMFFVVWIWRDGLGTAYNGKHYITTHFSTYELVSNKPVNLRTIIVNNKIEKKNHAE